MITTTSITVAALTVVVGISAGMLCLPLVSDLLCLLTRGAKSVNSLDGQPRLLFLVPAHDESGLVTGCVQSLVAQDYPMARRRIVVIADNCRDDTAVLARRAGAEVLERHDPALPGKPRALEWALRRLRDDPWEACVVIDADSTVAPGFATALAHFAPLESIAVQGYFGTLNEWDSWLTRLAGVLARARYEISYPIKQRAGINCPLTGNGMCLGRDLLREGWWAFSLTENWELYAGLTARGVPIRYAREARLFSQEASSMRQGGTQRRRWLAGRLGVLRAWGWRLLGSRQIGFRQKLDAMVELGGPSPVLHLVSAIAIAGIALVLGAPWASWIGGLALGSLLSLVLTTGAVLFRHPDPGPTLLAFVMLPFYALWRTGTALWTLVSLKDTVWRKTSR